jgi:hypothetical protein
MTGLNRLGFIYFVPIHRIRMRCYQYIVIIALVPYGLDVVETNF